MISQIAQDIQSQSVNSMVGGFSFAAAIAWMDVVRWIIANTVKTSKNGGIYYLITALATTLLAVLVAVGVATLALFVWGLTKQVFKATLFAGLASAGVWYWYFNVK